MKEEDPKPPETYEDLRKAVRGIEAKQFEGPNEGGITYTEAQKQRFAALARMDKIHEFVATKVTSITGK